MGSGLLPVAIGALIGGGPVIAYIGLRRAPVEIDKSRVEQSSHIADDALALLAAERSRFMDELAQLNRERGDDRERCRQLHVANEGLRDELEEKDREIARLRERLNRGGRKDGV
jgi:chromosome segregation ATPase